MKAADLHIFDVFSLNLRLRLRSIFNTFTAVLAAQSLGKTIKRGAKSEIIKAFCSLRMSTRKDFYQNVLKVDLLQDHQTYCLEACMCLLFSPEGLQAGAVNGLIFPMRKFSLENAHKNLMTIRARIQSP